MSFPLLKGGGTRTVSVEDDSNVQDLVKIGKSIFFPNGESLFGNIAEISSVKNNEELDFV